MKPIIFLEIDGILTTQKGTDEAMKRRGEIFDANGKEYFCPKAIEALNKITNATEADIVISSVWRLSMSLEEMQELFTSRRITGNVIGFTPESGGNPANDIELWMAENGRPKSFVIVDDINEIDEYTEIFGDDRCVGTQYVHGLAHKSCYKRSINYLNKIERVKKPTEKKNLF